MDKPSLFLCLQINMITGLIIFPVICCQDTNTMRVIIPNKHHTTLFTTPLDIITQQTSHHTLHNTILYIL